MPAAETVDILVVSLGSTSGLRAADDELCASLRRAGASVASVRPTPPAEVRTLMLTDLVWARAARAAAREFLERSSARAVIYSTTTAALLWPRPGAIRFDAPAAGNRRGRDGVWQRPLERLRLRQAPLLLPWSVGGLQELGLAGVERASVVLPVPVESSEAVPVASTGKVPVKLPGSVLDDAPPAAPRDIAAIAYGANPLKKGLDRVLDAWERARAPGEELLVTGVTTAQLSRAGLRLPPEGVRVTGPLPAGEYRALLRRSRVFVCAPRREDYGIAQLEALADGCQLVTTAAPGPYAALGLARELDGRLVGDALERALRLALDDPSREYSARARAGLVRFGRPEADRLVAAEVLPRLLPQAGD